MSLRETTGLGEDGSVGERLRGSVAAVRTLLQGDCERGQTGRSALTAFGIRVVGAGLAYLTQALLARWMGSFEYGIFVFVWVWVLILGGLAPLGLSTSSIRFVPEYRETGRLDLLRGLLRGSRLFSVGVSTLVMLVSLAILWFADGMLESHSWMPAFLILFCLPAYTLVDIQDGIARGRSWVDLALSPPYIIRPVLLLALMLVAAVSGFAMSAVTAAGCAVISYWASALIQTVMLERRLARDVPQGPRAYDFVHWLKTSLPLFLVLSFELLLQNTDILVLSRYMSPSEVAIYFAALKTIGLVAFVNFAVGAATANRFSALKARGDAAGLSRAVREAVTWTFWPSLAGTIALLALGKPLLWLFGSEFMSGYPVMFILAVGFLFRAAMGPAEWVLNMLGEQNRCAAVLSLSAIANLALNFALIPFYGIYGAAIATALSVSSAALVMFLVARSRLGINIFVWQRRTG